MSVSIGHGIVKPDADELVDIDVINANYDSIDSNLTSIEGKLGASAQVTISSSSWSDNKTVADVPIVKSSNNVFVSCVSDYKDVCSECGIKATQQSDGKLTFTCESVPSSDVVFNIIAFG